MASMPCCSIRLFINDVDKSRFGSTKAMRITLASLLILLILIFQVVELRILGEAYYKIDLWKKGDFDFLRKAKKISSNIILLAVILTIIEIFYLFKILLNLNIA